MSRIMKEGIFELALSGRKSAALLLAVGAGLLDEIGERALPRRAELWGRRTHP